MTLPDFLVIGPPKAATTALHAALSRHPRIHMSAVKEPKFFLSDGPPPEKGGPGDAETYREHVWRRPDYEALFREGRLNGEATPFYLYDQEAQRRIQRLIPEAKLIAVLRDPVERAHSNWTHLWSAGLEPIGDVVEACAAEADRVKAGWAPFWHYTGLGLYGAQLTRLHELFPREQVLTFRYRDLLDRPAQTLDQVTRFLGVEPGLIEEVPKENVTAHPHQTRTHQLLSTLVRLGDRIGGQRLTAPLAGVLQRSARARRPLTWEQRQELLPYFAADIAVLGEVTGEDYSDWLRPRDRSGGLVGTRPAGQRQARNGRARG